MSKYTWNQMELCARCHWKDEGPDLCRCVEPPAEKPFIPETSEDCYFLAETYWNRIPQSYKDSFEDAKAERSKR